MTREEEIKKAVQEFIEERKTAIGRAKRGGWYFANIFEEGIKWADEHPKLSWISVKDDLPCKHNDLRINNGLITKRVLVVEDNCVAFDRMAFRDNGWDWVTSICPSHWALIPKPPKE